MYIVVHTGADSFVCVAWRMVSELGLVTGAAIEWNMKKCCVGLCRKRVRHRSNEKFYGDNENGKE